ncbi:MAG: Crp/Fnr family transcriptional regulator [Candidatus Rokubacteria bacterium]|nr:Crp/Fnr family transcriptional regulator [Candidatus Rokubacteria bacterium]
MDASNAVTGSSLFWGLSARQREPFAALARVQRVPEDEYLFRLGQPAEALLIVESGVVELTMPLSMNGKEREVVVQEAGAGETIAWSALIEPNRFTMSARAGTNVELLAFSAGELQAAIEAHPEAGLRIVTNLARVIARRLQVMHAMWTRELQRAVDDTFGEPAHRARG